jgi:co-chaperonin GroES (HSP10)
MKLTLLLCFVSITGFTHPGIGIVEDSRGNIFYTDLAKVWKLTADGKKSVAVPNVHTHELFIDDNDNVFGEHLWYNGEAADTWGHYAWKLSKEGQFQKIIPDSEGFLEDYSFVRDHFGRMYWADRTNKCQHVVRKNTHNSTTVLGDQCMENIRWMTSTENGMIYLVDNHDLKKINTNGKVSTLGKATSDYAGAPTVDKQNNIYIADYSGKKITKIAVDGTSKIVFETSLLWGPMALIVASNGDYLVLESSFTNSVRVERVNGEGKRTVY